MPLNIIRDDIRNMRTDAIVNPSNPKLKAGSGVSDVVFETAGREVLQKYCSQIAPINIGEAAITPSFSFPVKYIIHTAGPVYSVENEEKSVSLLKQTYESALNLAEENRCDSIAFPLLSSGVYKFPKDLALKAAREAIENFLKKSDMDVYLLVFDKKSFKASEELVGAVKSYVDENYIEKQLKLSYSKKTNKRRSMDFSELGAALSLNYQKIEGSRLPEDSDKTAFFESSVQSEEYDLADSIINKLDDINNLDDNLEEPFAATLMKLIDEAGKTDAEVYKGANIDRKLFSKIRSKKDYTPTKTTILALSISLKLTLSQTEDLLRRAGYALSHSNKFDVIVEFFIKQKKYNIYEINEVLFSFEQPLLGSKNAAGI